MINSDEWIKISRDLEEYHSVFYKLWDIGKPVFTDTIETAAVSFDKIGKCIEFRFNPTFWKNSTHYDRLFVISHECLHVILNHGKRALDVQNAQIANKAMDVVVNHRLVDGFGFDRSKIKDADNLCWVDTVFPGLNIRNDHNFEYYYNLLSLQEETKQKVQKAIGSQINSNGQPSPELVDDHSNLPSDIEDLKESLEQLNSILNTEEKTEIADLIKKESGQQAGYGTGGEWLDFKVKIKPKKKWETVIKKWSQKYLNPESTIEHWLKSRRYQYSDILLPSDVEDEAKEKCRIKVWFFQDCSGSCAHLAKRFFTAARTLDPKRFDISLFYFDTAVIPTTITSNKNYFGGGTSFKCIEDYIQSSIKKDGLDYPKAVFVITDGYGDKVTPLLPQNWYWFLSHDYRDCIPKESNVYMLKDFE